MEILCPSARANFAPRSARLCFEFGLELDDVTSQKEMAPWTLAGEEADNLSPRDYPSQEQTCTGGGRRGEDDDIKRPLLTVFPSVFFCSQHLCNKKALN